jgi:hypothetical protein
MIGWKDNTMFLYIVSRTDQVGYDEYDSYVVAAANQDQAVALTGFNTHQARYYPEVQLIGTSNEDRSGILHSSFNAG